LLRIDRRVNVDRRLHVDRAGAELERHITRTHPRLPRDDRRDPLARRREDLELSFGTEEHCDL
jgi:hypothetical protein